jgi:alpha-1,3-mannosyltransferase
MSTLVTFALRAAREWPLASRLIPLLLAGELALCLLIVARVRYTPIDWKAYMQEVEGPLVHGNFNYSELRGETGPLVYPGGFVALYGALRRLAGGDGSDVRPAQWALAACYVCTLGAVALCHAAARPRHMPPWSLLLVCVSLRLHSIYVLRLFNDGWAMLGFWLACLCFCRGRWRIGCVCYSLGTSVKANVLLSAPGLLVLLLQAHGLYGALGHIALCAAVQLVLGLPFLLTSPFAYVRGALGGFGDLQQKWSVNWKLMPAPIFYHRAFPLALAALHLACLAALAAYVWTARQGGLRRAIQARADGARARSAALHPEHVLTTLVGCNAVGVLFARSLHFQFYCWYAHGVPLLLWRCDKLPLPLKLACVALLECAPKSRLEAAADASAARRECRRRRALTSPPPLPPPRSHAAAAPSRSVTAARSRCGRAALSPPSRVARRYAWSYGLERVEGTSTVASSACLQIAHAVLLYAIWRAEPPPLHADEADDKGNEKRA